jgi:hypothetical protein
MCALLVSRPSYDDSTFPTFTGSGGGIITQTDADYSYGGGLIFMQTYSLNHNNSAITCEGATSILSGGGGSGGTINIQTALISGNGVISARGGDGSSKTGSSGGGGRIALKLMLWSDNDMINKNIQLGSNISIVVLGGSGCIGLSCGGPGSIYSQTCLPGYQLNNNYLCMPCPNGTIKYTYGYSKCQSCSNLP